MLVVCLKKSLDGVTGFLVPPQDSASLAQKIIHLISKFEIADQMGEAGRVHATKNFSVEDYVKHTLNVYSQRTRIILGRSLLLYQIIDYWLIRILAVTVLGKFL